MPKIQFRTEGADSAVKGVKDLAAGFKELSTNAAEAKRNTSIPATTAKQDFFAAQNSGSGIKGGASGGGLDVYNSRITAAAALLGNFDAGAGQLLNTLGDVTGVLQTVKGGFAGIGTSGAALSGFLVILAAEMYALKKANEDLDKAQDDYIQALNEFGTRERKIREYSAQVNDEYLVNEQSRLNSERKILEAQIANNQRTVDEAKKQLERFGKIPAAIAGAFGGDVEKAEKNLAKLKDELGNVNAATEALNSAEVQRSLLIRNEIEAMQAEYEIRAQIISQIDNLTEAQVQQTIRTKEQLLALKQEEIQEIRTKLAKEQNLPDFIDSQQANAAGNFSTAAPAIQELSKSLSSATDEAAKLQQEIDLYNQVALPAAQANDQLKESTKELADSQKALLDVNKQLSDLAARRASVEQDLASAQAKINTDKLREFITSTLETRIEEAKAAEEQAHREQELVRIREQAAQQIVEVQRDLNSGLRELEADYLKERQSLIDDYYKSTLEALANYQIEESRSNEDYNRERLRQIRDLYSDLSDAALDNDIKRFIAIQKEGEKSLQDSAEDHTIETRRRAEDFARQQAQARAQFEQQLAEQAAHFEAERAARQTQAEQRIVEIQAQAQRELDIARQAGQQKLTESQRLEQQLANIRNQFRIQDETAARQIRLAGLQNELAALAAQEAAIVQIRTNATIELARALANAAAATSSPSQNITGSNTPINVNIGDVNVGDIATPQQLQTGLNALGTAVERAIASIIPRLAAR